MHVQPLGNELCVACLAGRRFAVQVKQIMTKEKNLMKPGTLRHAETIQNLPKQSAKICQNVFKSTVL